jgi:hypothetical protein
MFAVALACGVAAAAMMATMTRGRWHLVEYGDILFFSTQGFRHTRFQSFHAFVHDTEVRSRRKPDSFGGVTDQFRVALRIDQESVGASQHGDILGPDQSRDGGTVDFHIYRIYREKKPCGMV